MSCPSTSPRRKACARGKALDLEQNGTILGYDCRITGSANYKDTAGSDVVVITAGVPRKPGMSRDDLLSINLKIMRSVAANLKENCPGAFIIVISNPLDAMVYECAKVGGFDKNMVCGMAGVLDSARMQLFLAQEVGVSVKDVRAMRPRWPRRHHGAGDLVLHGERRAAEVVHRRGSAGCDRRPHGERRWRDRRSHGHLGLLRPATAAVAMAESFGIRSACCRPRPTCNGQFGIRTCTSACRRSLARAVSKGRRDSLTDDEKAMLSKSAAVRELVEVGAKL